MPAGKHMEYGVDYVSIQLLAKCIIYCDCYAVMHCDERILIAHVGLTSVHLLEGAKLKFSVKAQIMEVQIGCTNLPVGVRFSEGNILPLLVKPCYPRWCFLVYSSTHMHNATNNLQFHYSVYHSFV